jgi:hypothetical protein
MLKPAAVEVWLASFQEEVFDPGEPVHIVNCKLNKYMLNRPMLVAEFVGGKASRAGVLALGVLVVASGEHYNVTQLRTPLSQLLRPTNVLPYTPCRPGPPIQSSQLFQPLGPRLPSRGRFHDTLPD